MPKRPADSSAARAVLEVLRRPDYRPMPQRELLHRAHVPAAERPAVRRMIRDLIQDGVLRKVAGGKLAAAGEARRERPARGADLLGLFLARRRGGEIRPFDPAAGETFLVRPGDEGGAEDRHAVRAEIVRGAEGEAGHARVVEVLGDVDEPGTDVRVVVRRHRLAGAFPADAQAEARRLPATIDAAALRARQRFDDPAPVTIDGETAKDFDDAIAVAELPGGGYRLWVHIADVSHFVPPASALDREARRRGTSVYLPGTVVPMFPERLSNDLCSLRPGEDRLVQTAILDYGSRGAVRRVRYADGVIRSAARLTYTQVGNLLDGEPGHGVPRGVAAMLRVADRLRAILEKRRHARGSIDFDLPEPQILLDVEGVMTGIVVEARNRAHRMIEEFMLAANDAVASELERAGWPCLYRVHQTPDPARLAALRSFLESLGIDASALEGEVDSKEIQELLERVEDSPEAPVVRQVALRSMQQARYSTTNLGHFGLASPTYCHFTSPIRRYPDLVVHRLLRAERRGGRPEDVVDPDELADVASTSSELEREAEAAERELLSWKKVAFIEDRVGDVFRGVVTGVARFGLFVQLVDNMVEGLVRVEDLGDDWFDWIESRMELRGRRTGRAWRLGDALDVRVDRVDRALRRVDLRPVGAVSRRERRGDGSGQVRRPRGEPRTRRDGAGRRAGRSRRRRGS
jgi:ribonuclease R